MTAASDKPTVRLTVDGRLVEARQGQTLLEALRQAGYEVPTLCHLEGLAPFGGCRLCVVEVSGARTLVTACSQPVSEGMVVRTHTPAVHKARRQVLELLLADHPQECASCLRSDDCGLRSLAARYGARVGLWADGVHRRALKEEPDVSSPSIVRDAAKCILCGRCVRICQEQQGIGAIDFTGRGFDLGVAPAFKAPLSEAACVYCGQCVVHCPTGALTERDDTGRAWELLGRPDTTVVVQIAPAVRVSVAEAFGAPVGTPITGQIVAALRRLGFSRVFDTDFGADLTVMEEAAELVHRLAAPREQAPLPLMTSCCPGWVKYVEHYFPERLGHLSSCRSPHEMVGALAKTYYAEKEGLDPSHVVMVSIMPCTAKKFEAQREELQGSVDLVLTTRELVRMLRLAGIDPTRLEPEAFDPLMGASTGAAVIFGRTGGVAEAALRTAYWMATGKDLPEEKLEWEELHRAGQIRRLRVELGSRVLRCAVVDGLKAARELLESPEYEQLDFVEVMACPGGCVGGGGQMRGQDLVARVERRAQSLAGLDRTSPLRRAHENPEIRAVYQEYLGSPGSARSHQLLHTHYVDRGVPLAR
ncbi:[FeFe] hydrogenase, group A [Carboxydochorda subterranea]|uniref:[FeFe] hydrogenase, group A n=1 Tax=Carboxydichorda subterranea TaxID=3109565 RepID=A0ABZ1C122_9FIRM|nr:[FeFe] hydrogenase, group A [Limnochorda sp. L945t]WRP18790.1 [FeFe] hydrogenase, group A [Limnochorda sp. L945t]